MMQKTNKSKSPQRLLTATGVLIGILVVALDRVLHNQKWYMSPIGTHNWTNFAVVARILIFVGICVAILFSVRDTARELARQRRKGAGFGRQLTTIALAFVNLPFSVILLFVMAPIAVWCRIRNKMVGAGISR